MGCLGTFLADLERRGAVLEAVGAHVDLRARRPLHPDTRRLIAEHKAWLLAYLRARALPKGGGLALIVDAFGACDAQLELTPAGLVLSAGEMVDFAFWARRWLAPWAREAEQIGLTWHGAAATSVA